MSWQSNEKGILDAAQSVRRRRVEEKHIGALPIPLWKKNVRGQEPGVRDFGDLARRLLLDHYAPPSVLIDCSYNCLSCFGPVHRYLQPGSRAGGRNLLASAREELRPKLHAALRRAYGPADASSFYDATMAIDERFASLSITVLCIQSEGEELFLVSFLDVQAFGDQQHDAPAARRESSTERAASARFMSHPPECDVAAEQIAGLSPRQHAVLDLLAGGHSNKQIAADLGISQRTVESHRAIVMRKLGARTFADLIRLVATA